MLHPVIPGKESPRQTRVSVYNPLTLSAVSSISGIYRRSGAVLMLSFNFTQRLGRILPLPTTLAVQHVTERYSVLYAHDQCNSGSKYGRAG